ncbi:hypothetical protein [Sinorhizobium medicae]|uniref:hypothetical protein n=1 Tax=Sinorhizobium medicae TaxID=110321 RepID=UPI0016460979|nr:hypothetical protein [Sinorhizobium medicae]
MDMPIRSANCACVSRLPSLRSLTLRPIYSLPIAMIQLVFAILQFALRNILCFTFAHHRTFFHQAFGAIAKAGKPLHYRQDREERDARDT